MEYVSFNCFVDRQMGEFLKPSILGQHIVTTLIQIASPLLLGACVPTPEQFSPA